MLNPYPILTVFITISEAFGGGEKQKMSGKNRTILILLILQAFGLSRNPLHLP